jgi:glycosyltransferase involved in cell wall biosynthesis
LSITRILSCDASYNEGGLGKHLAQLVEAARSDGELGCYFTSRKKPNDHKGKVVSLDQFRWLFTIPPLRYSLSWRDFLSADLFDRAVARRLRPSEAFHGFSGRAQHSFVRARQLKYTRVNLECPNTHVAHAIRQHKRAIEASPIEGSWLNDVQYKKTLREYETADLIYVISEYSRQTFLAAGVPASKLQRRVLTVEPRFAPPIRSLHSDVFSIVYVGRLHVTKGLAVLLEAFGHVQNRHAELILVGGHGTDGMDKFLRKKLASDCRIKIRPGDPLPYLHRADVLIHPSFEDGLGLAPLEALACGVPVIVTEHTGMKEYVVNGQNGYIIPAGNIDALVEQITDIRRRPLKGRFKPFSPTCRNANDKRPN